MFFQAHFWFISASRLSSEKPRYQTVTIGKRAKRWRRLFLKRKEIKLFLSRRSHSGSTRLLQPGGRGHCSPAPDITRSLQISSDPAVISHRIDASFSRGASRGRVTRAGDREQLIALRMTSPWKPAPVSPEFQSKKARSGTWETWLKNTRVINVITVIQNSVQSATYY